MQKKWFVGQKDKGNDVLCVFFQFLDWIMKNKELKERGEWKLQKRIKPYGRD